MNDDKLVKEINHAFVAWSIECGEEWFLENILQFHTDVEFEDATRIAELASRRLTPYLEEMSIMMSEEDK